MRALCDKHGILMVADEVMAGFGRTGEWFAVDHWNVVPDLITMAKGLTSAYVPLGAVGMRRKIAAHFQERVFPGGLTYNSHPLACAAALATIAAYEEDDMIGNAQRMGVVMKELLAGAAGEASVHRRSALDRPVRDRRARPRPEDAPADGAVRRHLRRRWRRWAASSARRACTRFVRWNAFYTNPPLCITEAELREAFAIVDRALEITDRAVS